MLGLIATVPTSMLGLVVSALNKVALCPWARSVSRTGEAQGFGRFSYPASAEALEWEKAVPSRTALGLPHTVCVAIC